jgi:hypothetical protein
MAAMLVVIHLSYHLPEFLTRIIETTGLDRSLPIGLCR